MAKKRISEIKIGKRYRKDFGDIDALAASMKSLGLLQPVVLAPGGALVGGHRRIKAAKNLGWETIDCHSANDLVDAASILRAQLDENTCREALGFSESIEIGEAVAVAYKPKAEAAEKAGRSADGKAGGRGKKKPSGNLPEGYQDARDRETNEQAAKAAGMSRKTYEAGLKLKVECKVPELIQAVDKQLLAVSGAVKLLARPVVFQQKLAKLVIGGTKPQEAMRQVTAAEIAKKEAKTPSGKSRVIYADPPWSYGNSQPDSYREQRDHYPVMTVAEISKMPVQEWSMDNAVLFLWCTSPILEEAFDVVKAWGFKYKASFVWDKVKHNMGHYNSVRHEFLLICVRGACQPDVRKLFDSVITQERTAHSEKPQVIYEIIETLYTHGPYLELFSRKKHKGWKAHGYESQ